MSVSKAKGRGRREELRLVAPPCSHFSLSDWKGRTVTRCETTVYEYVGEERGWRRHHQPFLDLRGLHGFLFIRFTLHEWWCLIHGLFIFQEWAHWTVAILCVLVLFTENVPGLRVVPTPVMGSFSQKTPGYVTACEGCSDTRWRTKDVGRNHSLLSTWHKQEGLLIYKKPTHEQKTLYISVYYKYVLNNMKS